MMPRLWLPLALLALWPAPASAHLVGLEFGDFYAGALHLLSAPGDVIALLGLGLLAAAQPREQARWMLLALPLGIGAGLGVTALAPVLESVDPAVGAALAIPGVLGAFAFRLPAWALATLAGAVGVVSGLSNGIPAQGDLAIDWTLYAPGVLTAGTVTGTLLIALATVGFAARSWTPIAGRVLSSWVAAIGTIFLTLSLTGAAV